jgi:hypothetical protein
MGDISKVDHGVYPDGVRWVSYEKDDSEDDCGDGLWDAVREGFEADLDMGFDPYLGCYTDDV